ncbi:MAG: MurR/RpiR family transcriptional regulator [Chloroflexota bacterium]
MPVSQVRDRILNEFDSLSPKQRALARFLLQNEAALAFYSAGDIAAEVGISPATVVRFARALGYEGYTDLQDAVRATLPPYRTVAERMAERVANGHDDHQLPARVAEVGARTVRTTIAGIAEEELDRMIEAILDAEQIKIFGSGLSSAAAILIEYHLVMLGLSARSFLNEGVGQVLHLAHITSKDLVIVVSIWRYIRSTLEALEVAREAGATCVAITDSPVAQVAGLADHVLIADTEGPAHSRSLSGMVALVDLIAAVIADRRPEASMAAIERIEGLYLKNDMLLKD